MLGFDSIGSATLIAYDDVPVLTTDAWINDDAYFGSWTHDYAIPQEQIDAIRRAKYHWFSHGHPDHLNVDSLPLLTRGQILLADHYGGRIKRDLEGMGYHVRVLKDKVWVQLSDRIKIQTIANQNQDSILLLDVGGTLIINTNDSPDFGASFYVRKLARTYKRVYHFALNGWGGADMLNLFAPDGSKLIDLEPLRRPIAPRAQRSAMTYGAHYASPFSGFHIYQREDSAWANRLVPELEDYQTDALKNGPQMLPSFIRVNAVTNEMSEINPPRNPLRLRPSEDFGDNWSDPLTREDAVKIDQYFKARENLQQCFGFIAVTLGGKTHTVDLNRDLRENGITFEAPRSSFMTSLEYEIFDDMLIGNFMKTTLHGSVAGLYPDFSPFVAKYADNGGAKSKAELRSYFLHYFLRDPLASILKKVSTGSEDVVRAMVPADSKLFQAAKKAYYRVGSRRS
ncbi:MAG: hypothetical protein ACOYLK_14200 [Sphingomonas sp.]